MQLAVGILFLFLCATPNSWAATPADSDPDKDTDLATLLYEARALVDAKKPQAAIKQCDHIIARFKTHYENSKSKIYCAQTSAENLGYLVMAAAAMNKGEFDPDKKNAIVLSPTWSTAYFIKAYALQDLGRLADAKSVLQLALELSPWNSRYLSELGSIYVLEKNWTKAKEAFGKAEDQAPLASDETKAEVLARARRGLGYVFVELRQLDEAEKKYQQCLATDPQDTKAAEELKYVRDLRAKTKSR
jgi:tetratricopeptide (TPR) repeat protein